jgi:hypothetical protein
VAVAVRYVGALALAANLRAIAAVRWRAAVTLHLLAADCCPLRHLVFLPVATRCFCPAIRTGDSSLALVVAASLAAAAGTFLAAPWLCAAVLRGCLPVGLRLAWCQHLCPVWASVSLSACLCAGLFGPLDCTLAVSVICLSGSTCVSLACLSGRAPAAARGYLLLP